MSPREMADRVMNARKGYLVDWYHENSELIAHALRSQADEIDRIAEGIIRCIDASWRPNEARDWGRPELILSEYVDELHTEIAALKAAAIVQGSLKLDEAVTVATRREAIKAAWDRINRNRGWLSCAEAHDPRCGAAFHPHKLSYLQIKSREIPDGHCTCGADAFRRLMEE